MFHDIGGNLNGLFIPQQIKALDGASVKPDITLIKLELAAELSEAFYSNRDYSPILRKKRLAC